MSTKSQKFSGVEKHSSNYTTLHSHTTLHLHRTPSLHTTPHYTTRVQQKGDIQDMSSLVVVLFYPIQLFAPGWYKTTV